MNLMSGDKTVAHLASGKSLNSDVFDGNVLTSVAFLSAKKLKD
jgi:hypothetical protein